MIRSETGNKRVLYVDFPLVPSGGGQFSLAAMVCNLRSWSPVMAVSCYSDAYDIAKAKGVPIAISPIRKRNLPVDLLRALLLVNRIKPAVIHCNSATTFFTFVYAFIARINKIPFLWHSRVLETAGWKDDVIVRLACRTIAISEAVKNKFGRNTDKSSISVLYNAVDTKRFCCNMDTTKQREMLGLPADQLLIGVFSRLDWWKGHIVLIDAVQKTIRRINSDKVTLLIAGDGPCREEIKARARTTLGARAVFIDHRADVAELMNLCDIIVNPSTEPEPFGRTIIEAMACGKPVIATGIGGPLEIISHERDGFLCEPSAEPMALILEKLLIDPALRAATGSRARETVLKRFMVQSQIAALEDIYDSITKGAV